MKTVQDYIADQQLKFGLHPFFQRLEHNEPLRHVLPFASGLTFWVMVFQDVLRLNEAQVTDPELKKLARHHRGEDSGHDKWFLNDLIKIEGSNPDLRSLFGKQHRVTRDVSYALMSEVYRAQSDYERIVLLLTLESTGHIFFEKIASYFERLGVVHSLQYFSRTHIDVEKAHEMFEQQMEAMLAKIELPEEIRERCVQLVDRAYKAFGELFDSLEELIHVELDRPVTKTAPREQLLLSRENRLTLER
jgi:hypothetical protein